MARKKNVLPGSVFVVNGQLVLKIRLNNEIDRNGKPKYTKIYTRLADTKENRKLLEKKQYEIFTQQFLPAKEEKKVIRIQEAWEMFVTHKELLPKTLKNYRLAFDVITKKQNYLLTFDNVEEDVIYFKKHTSVERNFSAVTINTYLREFQAFLNFCTERNLLPETKFKTQFQKRETKKEVQIFTEEEIRLILADCEAHDKEFALLVELMLETGARPVDALNLLCNEVNLPNSIITWKNKITKIDEPTPVSSRAKEILQEAIALAIANDRNKVFRWQYSSLSPLTMKFNKCLQRCGIEKESRSFKHLRTTFKFRIRHLPFELQMRLMRHSKPDITLNHYTYVDSEELKERLDNILENKLNKNKT